MTRQLASVCAHCGFEHDLISGLSEWGKPENHPESGDATMCIACGEMNVFDDELMLRKPNDEESQTLNKHPHVKLMLQAWRETQLRKGRTTS